MELWLRWVVAVVALVVAIGVAVRIEKPVQRRLVRASRRSWRRAVGVLLAYHGVFLAITVVATLTVIAVRERSDVGGVLLTAALFMVFAPFTVPLMPGEVQSSSQRATAMRDLREYGATPAVTRVLGVGGAVLWFVAMCPGLALAVVGVFLPA